MASKTRVLAVGVLAGAALWAANCSEASAFGHWRNRWGGSCGGWHGYRAAWYGSAGSYGSYGGYGSYGSWGGYGSYGGWGGSYGGYGWGGSASAGGWGVPVEAYDVQEATPPAPPAQPPQPEPGDGAADTRSTYHPAYGPSRNSALLSVRVPADAKIFVNDLATTSAGSQRRYVSRNLASGRVYTYRVRAEMTLEGRAVNQEKVVKLAAGQSAELVFDPMTAGSESAQPAVAEQEKVETKLTLRVPDDAQVFLAGHETVKRGSLREYTTTRLSNGQEWAGYNVRVVVERDGRPVALERTLTFKGGESYELAFDFNNSTSSDRLAAAGE